MYAQTAYTKVNAIALDTKTVFLVSENSGRRRWSDGNKERV